MFYVLQNNIWLILEKMVYLKEMSIMMDKIGVFLLVSSIIFLIKELYLLIQRIIFLTRYETESGYDVNIYRKFGILFTLSYIITYIIT